MDDGAGVRPQRASNKGLNLRICQSDNQEINKSRPTSPESSSNQSACRIIQKHLSDVPSLEQVPSQDQQVQIKVFPKKLPKLCVSSPK